MNKHPKLFTLTWIPVSTALLCASLAAWLALAPPDLPPIKAMGSALNPCLAPPQFKIGYQRDPNGVVPNGKGFAFKGVSWLEAVTCTPGQLALTLQGQTAANEAPVLLVSLNGRELDSIQINEQPRIVNLKLPKSGLLRLAYLNDYYLSEVRAAFLEDIRLVNDGCTGLQAKSLPPHTGTGWATATTFTSGATLEVEPCQAGQLQFRLVGRSGGGSFPRIQITQGSQIIRTVEASGGRQLIRVPVTRHTVKLTLVNPYFKELADRNLFLREWTFIPAPPTSP